jgi:hypothetical protein
MYHDVRNANGTWQVQGWGAPGGSTGLLHVAEAAMPNGSTQFVGVTSTGILKHNIRFANGSWQGWNALSQPGVTVEDADIAGLPNGSAQIVETTDGGAVLHNVRNANGSWQPEGWASIGIDGGGTVSVALTGMPDGSAQFIEVASTGQLLHNIRFANGSWQGWNVVSSDYYFTGADIAGMPDGSAQIVAQTPNYVMLDIRDANGSWQSQGFVSVGAPVNSAVTSVTAMPNGSSQFVDVTLAGNTYKIYHDVRNANGTWQPEGWAALPDPPGNSPVVSADIAGMPNGSSQLTALTQN